MNHTQATVKTIPAQIVNGFVSVAVHWQMAMKETLTPKYSNVSRYLRRLPDQKDML